MGFKWQIYTFGMITNGYTEKGHIVNIIRINSILVNSDINNGSYLNGTEQSSIYSFIPADDLGMKIIQTPKKLV